VTAKMQAEMEMCNRIKKWWVL